MPFVKGRSITLAPDWMTGVAGDGGAEFVADVGGIERAEDRLKMPAGRLSAMAQLGQKR
jgi:hypothetical protein